MPSAKWIKNCFTSLIDPDRESEAADLERLLYAELRDHRRDFSLLRALGGRDYKHSHLARAQESLYSKYLERAYRDGVVTPAEQRGLEDIARLIGLPTELRQKLDVALAKQHFAETLARAMDDGDLSAEELQSLEKIARGAGATLRDFTQRFFASEGEAFLRSIFANAVAERRDPRENLRDLLATAQQLGFSREQALAVIRTQASAFVEHVLADAKSDGSLSPKEEEVLRWMIHNLDIPDRQRAYVESELHELRQLTDIAAGKIAAQPAPAGLSTKAGELVFFHAIAEWRFTRELRSGPVTKAHDGMLVITDSRLAFLSLGRAHSVPFRRVAWLTGGPGVIYVQAESKPVDLFRFRNASRVPYAIAQAVLDMCNQKMIRNEDDRRTRHIPREVRQRVWQKYSGRCADCGSDSYLEFDHIVPFAKGGSNSDVNVQLLCRACNLKKSDSI